MPHLTVRERRNARRRFYHSGFFWAFGNGLTSASLVFFMLEQLGYTSSLLFSILLAAPFCGGLFRIFIPTLMEYIPYRKLLCTVLYTLQVLALIHIAAVAVCFPDTMPVRKISILCLLWFLANAAEQSAYVVFISWNAALVARRNLGRFYGVRERWKLSGECAGILLGITVMLILYGKYSTSFPPRVTFWNYIILLLTGCGFILASCLFFLRIPDPKSAFHRTKTSWREFFHTEYHRLSLPFRNRAFRPLLLYSALFAFFVQFEQTSRLRYVEFLLPWGMTPFIFYQLLNLLTRSGQIFLTAKTGKLVDRIGPLPVMIRSQFLTALPMFCYLFATQERFWLPILGAVIWISYVGLNVALPKAQLLFSDSQDPAPWLAVYQTCSVCGVLALIFGGILHDFCGTCTYFYPVLFSAAFFWRAALVLPLWVAKKRLDSEKERKNQEKEELSREK